MLIDIIYFAAAVTFVLYFFKKSNPKIILLILSLLFLVSSCNSDDLLIYSLIVLFNAILKKYVMPNLKTRWLADFFPLIYVTLFLLFAHTYTFASAMGLSYLILGASLDLKSSSPNNQNFLSWLIDHAVNMLSYPRMLVGPISVGVRVQPQPLASAHYRILKGIAKTLIILPLFRKYDFNLNEAPSLSLLSMSSVYLKLGLWHYVDLYLEFSGAIDIVIGIFGLLSIQLNENFNRPYFATSVSDFWRRWHMTLGHWISQAVYIPLGGNRHGFLMQVFAIFSAMLVSALWHGRTIQYVIWGMMQAAAIVFEKIIVRFCPQLVITNNLIKWVLTQVFVLVSWVVFFNFN